MEYMQAVVVRGPNDVQIANDVPKPVPGDYEALVKVHTCGFCNGTDMQIISGTLEQGAGSFPTVLGHEGAGEIVAVGKKVRHIRVGERWIHPNLHPTVGNGYSKTHGSMAQFGLVSDNQAMLEDGYTENDFPWVKQHRFPSTISYEDAAVLLSLAECHSAARNFGASRDMEVLIYGAGPMGIALAMFYVLQGAHVTQVDGIDERLLRARQVAHVEETINFTLQNPDAVLKGKRFDLVIDAVGFTKILYEGSQRLKPGGKLGSLGVLRKNDLLVDTSRLQCNTSLHMLNFPWGEYTIMDETIALIESKKIRPKDFYSHVLPYSEIHTALSLVNSKKALKVVLAFT